jgi:hypothetical protein
LKEVEKHQHATFGRGTEMCRHCSSLFQSEQLVNKFFCKLGKSAAQTLVILQVVYSDEAFKKSVVCDW